MSLSILTTIQTQTCDRRCLGLELAGLSWKGRPAALVVLVVSSAGAHACLSGTSTHPPTLYLLSPINFLPITIDTELTKHSPTYHRSSDTRREIPDSITIMNLDSWTPLSHALVHPTLSIFPIVLAQHRIDSTNKCHIEKDHDQHFEPFRDE